MNELIGNNSQINVGIGILSVTTTTYNNKISEIVLCQKCQTALDRNPESQSKSDSDKGLIIT